MAEQRSKSRLQKQPTIVSEFFKQKNTQMEDSLEDFQDTKKLKKTASKATKKQQQKIIKKPKGQKDIRTALKKNNLLEYTAEFHNVCRDSGVDVDSEQLQIAIALSKSLKELDESNAAKASEPQQSCDITDNSTKNRATKIRNTLLEYGFSVPEIKKTKSREVGKRLKINKKYTKLLTSTLEEKKQKISDKVSQILFNISRTTKYTSEPKSCEGKYLYKLPSEEYHILKNDACFYVHGLVDIASNTAGCLLKDWSKIPGRPESPPAINREYVQFVDLIDNQEDLDVLLSGTLVVVTKLMQQLKGKQLCENSIENCKETNEHKYLDRTNLENSFVNMQKMEASVVRSYSPDIFDDEPSINLVKDSSNILNSEKNTNVESKSEETHNFNSINESLTSTKFLKHCKSIDGKASQTFENTINKTTLQDKSKTCVLDLTTENEGVDLNINIDLTQSSNSSLNSLPCVNLSGNTSKPDIMIDTSYDDNDKEVSKYLSDYKNESTRTLNYSIEIVEKIDLTEESDNVETANDENFATTEIRDTISVLSSKVRTQKIKQGTENEESKINVKSDLTRTLCSPQCETFNDNNLEETENDNNLENFVETKIPNLISNLSGELTTQKLISPTKSDNQEIDDKIDLTQSPCSPQSVKFNIENFEETKIPYLINNLSGELTTEKLILPTISDEQEIDNKIDLTQSPCSPQRVKFDDYYLEELRNENNVVSFVTTEITSIMRDLPIKICTKKIVPTKSEERKIHDKIDLTQSLCSPQIEKFNKKYLEEIEYDNINVESFAEIPSIISDLPSKICTQKLITTIASEEREINDRIDLSSPHCGHFHDEYLGDMENYHNDNDGVIVGGVSFNSKEESLIDDKTVEYSNYCEYEINYNTNDTNCDKENILKQISTHECFTETKLNSTEIITELPKFNDEILSQYPTNSFEISDEELDYSMQYFHKEKRKLSRISKINTNDAFESPNRILNTPSTSKCFTPKRSLLRRTKSLEIDISLPEVEIKGIQIISPTKKIPSTPNSPAKKTPNVTAKKLNRSTVVTPGNTEYIVKVDNITPLVDYASMETPKVHKELEKYGIRPFKRKRAVQLLENIYYKTHPIMECINSEDGNGAKKKKIDLNDVAKEQPPVENDPNENRKDKCKENIEIYEQTEFKPTIGEISYEETDLIFQKREKAKIHSCRVPLHIAFHNYLHARPLLRSAILRYQPVSIDTIHKQLVKEGHRYDPKELLRFMDNKCITVKTAEGAKNGGKRTGKKKFYY